MELPLRLKRARKHAGLTQKALAALAKVEQPLISQIETGSTLKSAHIAKIAHACGVNPLWLSEGIGEMLGTDQQESWHSNVEQTKQPHRKPQEYPLISWVAAGRWHESCDNFQPGDADEWLFTDVSAGPHGYWLEVKGPSMLPLFTEGMRILVRPEGFDLISGKFYIAKLLSTGETTFKQYIRDGGLGFLQPLNSAFPVLQITDNVQIIGQVVDGKLPPIF